MDIKLQSKTSPLLCNSWLGQLYYQSAWIQGGGRGYSRRDDTWPAEDIPRQTEGTGVGVLRGDLLCCKKFGKTGKCLQKYCIANDPGNNLWRLADLASYQSPYLSVHSMVDLVVGFSELAVQREVPQRDDSVLQNSHRLLQSIAYGGLVYCIRPIELRPGQEIVVQGDFGGPRQ